MLVTNQLKIITVSSVLSMYYLRLSMSCNTWEQFLFLLCDHEQISREHIIDYFEIDQLYTRTYNVLKFERREQRKEEKNTRNFIHAWHVCYKYGHWLETQKYAIIILHLRTHTFMLWIHNIFNIWCWKLIKLSNIWLLHLCLFICSCNKDIKFKIIKQNAKVLSC